ncbi:MAG: tetratricopeptide repeat protein [Treponema sp.]|nr:tetratricopeptide repeat protein [Treponema sp.]
MIEIAFAVHDWYGTYWEYLGVSLFSVMQNTKSAVRFHILCDRTLSADARTSLTSLCAAYGHKILFYDITLDDRIPVEKLLQVGYCEGILYRLYLPEFLPDVPKILYLDADILAHMDIQELWNEDIGGCACAGCWDPPLFGYKDLDKADYDVCLPFWEQTDWNAYINSGVLVLNLERIRKEHKLLEEAIAFWNTYGWAYPDQDALNYILRGKTCLISTRYNMFAKNYPPASESCLYHYSFMAGERNVLNPLDKLYLSYWEKSPFYKRGWGKKEKAYYLRQMKNRTESYERLRLIRPLNEREMFLYAQNLNEKGGYEKATAVLQTAPECCMQIKSYALGKLGRIDEALSALRPVLLEPKDIMYHEHDLHDMYAWDDAGLLYMQAGRYEEAEKAFLHCLYFGTPQKNACAVKALMHLVSCMLHAGTIDKAKAYFNMLYGLEPMNGAVHLCGFQIQMAEKNLCAHALDVVPADVPGTQVQDAETIEIAYALHDYFGNYYEYMGISMLSVMENTKRAVRFHILCDWTLSGTARKLLSALCASYNQQVVFYDMKLDERVSLLNLLKSGCCEGAVYRLYLPEFLPDVPKILYLDTDILVHGDIQNLWNMDISDCAVAGRWDPPLSGCKQTSLVMPEKCQRFYATVDWKKFVNSGVLLMNLDCIRRECNLIEESLTFWEKYGWSNPAQDAINYILRGKIRFIPAQYNMCTKVLKKAKHGIIYHFTDLASTDGGLNEVERLYLSYWEKSPFYNKEWGVAEKVYFLRQMKNRSETGLRLYQLDMLTADRLLMLAENLLIMEDAQKAYNVLCDDRFAGDAAWARRRAWLQAQALEKLGRIEDALSALRPTLVDDAVSYVQHDVKDMEQWNYYGQLCVRLGQYTEAEAAFLHGVYFGTSGKNNCGTTSLYLLVDCARRMGNAEKERQYTIMYKTLVPYDYTQKSGEGA